MFRLLLTVRSRITCRWQRGLLRALGPVPAPTALVGVSLLVTVILAGINRGVSRWAAGHRRRAVIRDLRGLCHDEVERAVVAPVRAEDSRQVMIASFIARLHL